MTSSTRDATGRSRARIVALGGGTGLPVLLRGPRSALFPDGAEDHDRLVGIVTVTDEGGSSGRLREATGILPPGDIRQCLVALSEAEGLTGRLFQYRFSDEHGLAAVNPPDHSLQKYRKEMARLERIFNERFNTVFKMLTLGQHQLTARFFETRASKVVQVLRWATTSWSKTRMRRTTPAWAWPRSSTCTATGSRRGYPGSASGWASPKPASRPTTLAHSGGWAARR